MDWNPSSGGANGTLIPTEDNATVPLHSRLFSGNKGTIYEIGLNGSLKAYRDMTGSGGSLLTPRYYFTNPDQSWPSFDKIWADTNGNILATDDTGNLHLYQVVYPSSGTTGSTTRKARLDAADPALTELRQSSKIWTAGDKVYGLLGSQVRVWDYSFSGEKVSLGTSGRTIATGLSDVRTAWSPGPGTVYTLSGPSGLAPRLPGGVVRGYTGAPSELRSSRDEVAVGIFGDVLVNAVPCITEASEDAKPFISDAAPDMTGVPEVPATLPTDPTPPGPAKVSGKFVLGDGSPAAGLPVTVEATDARGPGGEAVDLPDLGSTRTAQDGTWSLTLPDVLPTDIQKAADDNGGALNVTARTDGVTTSGVPMIGTVSLVAAPDAPVSGQPTAFAASSAADAPTTTPLLPLLNDENPDNSGQAPTAEQSAQTYAAKHESAPLASNEGTPKWQSDRAPAPSNFDPYVINGADIRSQKVTPYENGSGCQTFSFREKSVVAYTAVGEGHAYWDARSSVEYSNKLSSQFDSAISFGSKWTVSGKVSRGSSAGISTHYAYRGPYFSKQWTVPIEWHKERWETYCGAIPTLRGKYWRIVAGGYKVPPGGATAKFGKDVMNKDGMNNYLGSRPEYRAVVPRDTYFALTRGRSSKIERAATAYGITFSAQTTYDRDHAQRIYAGRGRSAHAIWGRSGPLHGNPGMFHSY
ncbi:hypothetical protein [Streptomyces sp. DH12]|uniref:hypothetical protein n=1 Tax=Streptomyces sp. DH12 TaxID=2857010 RepID=UPI001E396474|nr:hypothetical protein [Streptomyces sp. DH12]